MAERNNSHLLDGGDDPMGMTDNQYKGMLLDLSLIHIFPSPMV